MRGRNTTGVIWMTKDKALRAVLYLRVSTERQARRGANGEGYSLPAQREACAAKAESLGAIVVEEYVDAGESARSADRPALKQLLERVGAGGIDLVVVHKLDRLARNRRDDVEIAFQLQSAGATLVSVAENIDNSPSGLLMHGILASFAEFYSKNLGAEAKKGMMQKVQQGGTANVAPLGYLNKTTREGGSELRYIDVDMERAEHIAWGFEAFASGEYSVSSLTEALQDRGLTNRPTPSRPERPVSRSAVHRMLQHPYYIGKVRFKGVVYDGTHTPIVDDETWHRVQDQLVNRRQGASKEQNRVHYLRGLLRCDDCGERIGLTYSRGKTGKLYAYFYCIGKQKSRFPCTMRNTPIEHVENEVAAYYRYISLPDSAIDALAAEVGAYIDELENDRAESYARDSRRLSAAKDEERKLLQAHYAGAVSLELMQEEQQRISRLKSQIETMMSMDETTFASLRGQLATTVGKARNLQHAYRLADGPIRSLICHSFFTAIYITPDTVTGVDLADPWPQLLDPDLKARIEREKKLPLDVQLQGEVGLVDEPIEERSPLSDAIDSLLDPFERPNGKLGHETRKPDERRQACTRRVSNLTLLAEGEGFEPSVTRRLQRLSRPPHSSALATFRP